MGEWKATMEFVGDLIAGRAVSRENLLWLTHLLDVTETVLDEGTDDELRAAVMATPAFRGWGLRQGVYPVEELQRVREENDPDAAPCSRCKTRKGGEERIRKRDGKWVPTGTVLCHICMRDEFLPKRFGGLGRDHGPQVREGRMTIDFFGETPDDDLVRHSCGCLFNTYGPDGEALDSDGPCPECRAKPGHPSLVYVVACRPYAEKVAGGKFYYEEGEAEEARGGMDAAVRDCFRVYPATLAISGVE